MEIRDYAFHSNHFIEDALHGHLPLKDTQAYIAYPDYRWVFHKPDLYQKQGIPCCPHGIHPQDMGIEGRLFSKPATNLLGLSTGAEAWDEYPDIYNPGYMWMPYLEGEHISIDVYVQDGNVEHVFDLVVPSVYDKEGSFLLWEKVAPRQEQIDSACSFIEEHLQGWSGITNVEMIGNSVLEIPLRTGTQFIDFYFEDWADAVKELTGMSLQRERFPVQNLSYVVRSSLQSSVASQIFSISEDTIGNIKKIETDKGANVYLPWKNEQPLQAVNHDGSSVRLAFINAIDIGVARASWEALFEEVFAGASSQEITVA